MNIINPVRIRYSQPGFTIYHRNKQPKRQESSEHMKLIYIIVAILILLTQTAQTAPLSQEGKIHLITCTPGDELYSIFGHSAIRVEDPAQGIDIIFNYGTFDFMTPNFYLKFMNGPLDYMLSVTSFTSFVNSYTRENRGVTAHLIDLDTLERQQVWDYLLWNAQKENRNYRYDFFFDNCATRIRDLFFKVKGYQEEPYSTPQKLSYRDHLHQYLTHSPWLSQGIDIVLGLKADTKATRYSSAFLPDHLDTLLLTTQPHSLIKNSQTIITPQPTTPQPTPITPTQAALILLALYLFITIYDTIKQRTTTTADRILFLITGLVGLLISYLWFLTDHKVTVWNLNILWAMPTYLVLKFIPRTRIKHPFWRYLTRITTISQAIVLLAGPFLPQYFPPLVYPVALTLLVRTWNYTGWSIIKIKQQIKTAQ